jgi:hypothetical protein
MHSHIRITQKSKKQINKINMNKKILIMIAALFAVATVNAGTTTPVAVATTSPVAITADATYYTKFLNKGVVAFDDVVVAATAVEAYGFVAGVKTYNTIQSNPVGQKIASSGLFKRVDTTLAYKFTSPLANLSFGTAYSSYSKSASSVASSSEPFVALDGTVYKTFATWDVKGRADLTSRTNNIEANVRLPFGFNHLKVVPVLGYGFNDPTAATIAAFKDAKQYCVAGIGLGYYTKVATLNAGVYQRRDSLFTAGNTVNGVSAGVAVKF